VASIGLAAGGGMYPESVGATVIGLVALSAIRRIEGKEARAVRRRITVTTTAGVESLPAVIAAVREAEGKVRETEYESGPGEVTVTLDVQVRADVAAATLLRTLGDQPGVAHVRIGAPG
jgi:uncharacterized membrane protein YhiD involved in acid resistance